MKHFIIDGNNLIGKIKTLNTLHKKNKFRSAEKLCLLISRYFISKRVNVSLHFDGFEKDTIKVPGINIVYSGKLTADEKIKKEIENSKNAKNIILVTSDNNLVEFGRVCSCQVIKCEEFSKLILSSRSSDEEKLRIEAINNEKEFRKLFGLE